MRLFFHTVPDAGQLVARGQLAFCWDLEYLPYADSVAA